MVLSVQFLQRVSIVLGTLLMLFVALPALAADVLIAPSTGSYSPGQTFTVTIQADPKGESVNAVEAELSFDPSVVSVVSTSKNGSAFSLWTTEPEFSNTAGTISFGGGSPTPFSTRSALLTVTLRAQTAGDAAISFTDASVLAADGQGTDVLDASIGATYTIAQGATPPPTTTPPPETSATPSAEDEDSGAAIAFGEPPRAPEVGSQEFLDPNVWYNESSGVFTWDLPFDVTEVAVAIASSSDFVPSDYEEYIYDPAVEDFSVTEDMLSDGVQYLSVQFKNQVGWGAVNNRRIQIDTTPPDQFDIDVRSGTGPNDFPTLVFEAEDETSGIQRYELEIAGREPVDVTPDEARLGYLLGELENGTYTARITAFDHAGNETTSSVAVLITADWVAPAIEEEESNFWSFLTGANILIFVLLLIIVMLSGYMYYERKLHRATEQKLRRETKEIGDQMSKIFSALRDEIYDQINTITKRPRLSKKEKEAVEQLNQALEVSETLIEKEINDVKSILK